MTDPDKAEEGVEALLARHRGLVHLIARRHFPHMSADPDLLQCGLIGLWEAARGWSGAGSFTSYAGRSVLNNMNDYARSLKRQTPPVGRRGGGVLYEDRIIERLDLLDRIKAAWPENSRERLVLLALASGVSRHGAAAALGVDQRTLRRIAARAMERLRSEDQGIKKGGAPDQRGQQAAEEHVDRG